ncbi:MAG: chemotaxis protein CheW [Actinomycetota bacterium]|jgi:purine-binding chemotaxis protein CheW|nr:chemotaxis protein CheW [Actinomycetota bacterium]
MTAYVRVSLGGESYGVDVAHVRGVAELDTVVAVPGAGPHVAGISHLQGEILPIVRISDLLRAPQGEPRQIVVVQDGERRAGLAVDAAEQVEELPEPTALDEPLTHGAILHDGRTIGIVDVPALLDAVSASVL